MGGVLMKRIKERIRRIKMLLLDVDGVMTDGTLLLGPGKEEMKKFHIHDGIGIVMARAAGLRIGILTGRNSKAVRRRARELGVDELKQGFFIKEKGYELILEKHGLKDEEVAYVGDDVIDLPVLKRVGFAVSVANGVDEVKNISHYITKKRGGEGAVREVVELLLSRMGRKERALRSLLKYGKGGRT
jgi:3-deoxy-D-manno-octulosonate 8-phosphate phosphatase (KDO 8-P phosphatase)